MSRDEAVYLEDMVEACTRVIEYTAGLDAAALRADRRTIDAVVRNLGAGVDEIAIDRPGPHRDNARRFGCADRGEVFTNACWTGQK